MTMNSILYFEIACYGLFQSSCLVFHNYDNSIVCFLCSVMNWSWTKSRISKWQQEKKKQREFFERQRLMTTVKRVKTGSPSRSKSRGISQDILSIDTINRTHDIDKNTVNKRKNVIKVNLDEMSHPVRHNKTLDLGPVHPVPSKIDILEVAESCTPAMFELPISKLPENTKSGTTAFCHPGETSCSNGDHLPSEKYNHNKSFSALNIMQNEPKEHEEVISPMTPFQPYSKPGPKVTFSTQLQYKDHSGDETESIKSLNALPHVRHVKAQFWESETPFLSENGNRRKQQSTVFDRHVAASDNLPQRNAHRADNWFSRPPNNDKLELFTEYHKPEDFQMTPLRKYERNSPNKKRQKNIYQSVRKIIGLDDDSSLSERTRYTCTSKHYNKNQCYSSVLDVLDDGKYNRKRMITNQFCKTRRDDTIIEISDIREDKTEKEDGIQHKTELCYHMSHCTGVRTIKSSCDRMEETPIISVSLYQSITLTTALNSVNQHMSRKSLECPVSNEEADPSGQRPVTGIQPSHKSCFKDRLSLASALGIRQPSKGQYDNAGKKNNADTRLKREASSIRMDDLEPVEKHGLVAEVFDEEKPNLIKCEAPSLVSQEPESSEDIYSGDIREHHYVAKDSYHVDTVFTNMVRNNMKETSIECSDTPPDNRQNGNITETDESSFSKFELHENGSLNNKSDTGFVIKTLSQRDQEGLDVMVCSQNNNNCLAVNHLASHRQNTGDVIADTVLRPQRHRDDRIVISTPRKSVDVVSDLTEIQGKEKSKLPLASNHILTDTAVTCHVLTVPSVDEYSQTYQPARATSPSDTQHDIQHGFSHQLSSVSTQTEEFLCATSGTRFIIYQHDSTQTDDNPPLINICSSKTNTKRSPSDLIAESTTMF